MHVRARQRPSLATVAAAHAFVNVGCLTEALLGPSSVSLLSELYSAGAHSAAPDAHDASQT